MDEFYIGTHIQYSERELLRLEKEIDDEEEATVRQIIAEGFLDSFSDDESDSDSDSESLSVMQSELSMVSPTISLTNEVITPSPIESVPNTNDDNMKPPTMPMWPLSLSFNVASFESDTNAPLKLTRSVSAPLSDTDCNRENGGLSLRYILYLIALSVVCTISHHNNDIITQQLSNAMSPSDVIDTDTDDMDWCNALNPFTIEWLH